MSFPPSELLHVWFSAERTRILYIYWARARSRAHTCHFTLQSIGLSSASAKPSAGSGLRTVFAGRQAVNYWPAFSRLSFGTGNTSSSSAGGTTSMSAAERYEAPPSALHEL